MTAVMNLSTGEIIGSYSLPPELAVRNAWLQNERNDFNTWDYEKAKYPTIYHGKLTVSCGDYCAFTQTELNRSLYEASEV